MSVIERANIRGECGLRSGAVAEIVFRVSESDGDHGSPDAHPGHIVDLRTNFRRSDMGADEV